MKQAGQKVRVTVPETASIEGLSGASTVAVSPYPVLALLTKGLPVTVWRRPRR